MDAEPPSFGRRGRAGRGPRRRAGSAHARRPARRARRPRSAVSAASERRPRARTRRRAHRGGGRDERRSERRSARRASALLAGAQVRLVPLLRGRAVAVGARARRSPLSVPSRPHLSARRRVARGPALRGAARAHRRRPRPVARRRREARRRRRGRDRQAARRSRVRGRRPPPPPGPHRRAALAPAQRVGWQRARRAPLPRQYDRLPEGVRRWRRPARRAARLRGSHAHRGRAPARRAARGRDPDRARGRPSRPARGARRAATRGASSWPWRWPAATSAMGAPSPSD